MVTPEANKVYPMADNIFSPSFLKIVFNEKGADKHGNI